MIISTVVTKTRPSATSRYLREIGSFLGQQYTPITFGVMWDRRQQLSHQHF